MVLPYLVSFQDKPRLLCLIANTAVNPLIQKQPIVLGFLRSMSSCCCLLLILVDVKGGLSQHMPGFHSEHRFLHVAQLVVHD